MVRYNPLIQRDTKRIEVVRPQIVNTIVKQTNDKVMIDKIDNEKILVGKDDAIGCSSYSVSSLKQEILEHIPVPLNAGSNIFIKDNLISAQQYDDAGIKKSLQGMEAQLNTTRQEFTTQLNLINQAKDDLVQNTKGLEGKLTDLYDLNSGNIEMVGKHKANLDAHKTETVKQLEQLDEKLNNYLKINDEIQHKIENSHLESIKLLEQHTTQMSKVLEGVDKKIEAGAENSKVQVEEIYDKCADLVTKADIKASNQTAQVREDMKGIESVVLAKVEKLMANKSKEIEQKLSDSEKRVNTANAKIQKNMEQMNQELQVVKDANPNSKEFSRVIKKLTGQMTEIQSAFNFKHLQK